MKKTQQEYNYKQYLGESASELISTKVKLKYVMACFARTDGKEYYEIAEVKHGLLGNFVPVTINFMVRFAKNILRVVRQEKEKNFFPEQMLIFRFPVIFLSRSLKSIMFVDEPAEEKWIYYKGQKKLLRNVPKFYYLIEGSSLYIYERKGAGFIGCNLPNISTNGSVCMGGSVTLKSGMTIGETMDAYYDAFWASSFNSHADATGFKWAKAKSFTYKQRDMEPFQLKTSIR